MRRAMAEAEVGDDDYGEDPTVRALEEAFAERVGKPAALFVASGVMANQIAVRMLTTPGTAVVAGRRQHLVSYEYGAAALNSGVQFIGLDDRDGMLSAAEVRWARQAVEHHQPAVSLVSVENTHMAASGAPWTEAAFGRVGRGRRPGAHPHGRGPAVQCRGGDRCVGRAVGVGGHDRDVLPVQGTVRAGRFGAGGRGGGHGAGTPGTQAARRRHAPSRRAGRAGTGGPARHGRTPARGPPPGGPPGRGGGDPLARLRPRPRCPCERTS